MMERKLTLGAVALAALLAGSGCAVYEPASVSETGGRAPSSAGGPAVYPSVNQPAGVPDSNPSTTGRQTQSPPMRDSRNTPSPITPGNISDSNTSATTHDRTNDGGMGIGSGSTR